MAKILVIDDDNAICMSLGVICSSVGHTVEMATSGRAGIDKGSYFRPDVILTDWMLRDGIDGVAAVDTIRAIHPDCHAVLLTSFAAEDVRAAALQSKFFGFFEKPVAPDKIHAAIDKAMQTPFLEIPSILGMVEFDADGKLNHLNARAKEILGVSAKAQPKSIREVFSYRSVAVLKSGNFDDWEYLSSAQEKNPKRCQGRRLPTPPGRPTQAFLVTCGDDEAKDAVAVRRFLERPLKRQSMLQAPKTRCVLIVDQDKLQRRLTTERLQHSGLLVHAAEGCDRALKTLEHDQQIQFVVLDHTTPGDELAEVVKRVREIRPEATLVGTSSGYAKDAFEQVGVDRFVLKPVIAPTIAEMAANLD